MSDWQIMSMLSCSRPRDLDRSRASFPAAVRPLLSRPHNDKIDSMMTICLDYDGGALESPFFHLKFT
jgi:hypothetical protein